MNYLQVIEVLKQMEQNARCARLETRILSQLSSLKKEKDRNTFSTFND